MTREQRRLRRQWITVYLIIAAAILALAGAIVWADPWQPKEIERIPHEPPYETFVDHPVRTYLRDDIPLDEETQEILYNACQEWGVPYELALAVCWRETNYQHLVTEVEGRTYYGMMAVQLESAESYMEQCGVETLEGMENSLRVGCCILGDYFNDYGTVRALMAYNAGRSGAEAQWALGVGNTIYTTDIINYMEDLMT